LGSAPNAEEATSPEESSYLGSISACFYGACDIISSCCTQETQIEQNGEVVYYSSECAFPCQEGIGILLGYIITPFTWIIQGLKSLLGYSAIPPAPYETFNGMREYLPRLKGALSFIYDVVKLPSSTGEVNIHLINQSIDRLPISEEAKQTMKSDIYKMRVGPKAGLPHPVVTDAFENFVQLLSTSEIMLNIAALLTAPHFNQVTGTEAVQVEFAKLNEASQRVFLSYFDQLNAHGETFEAMSAPQRKLTQRMGSLSYAHGGRDALLQPVDALSRPIKNLLYILDHVGVDLMSSMIYNNNDTE
jgi:hypothetical protein